jgi:AmmeMemoRadiSam system protein B
LSPIRQPAVAGRFYPADEVACARAVDGLLPGDPVAPAIGAVVPHAGWVFSGSTAALAIAAVAATKPETIVIFGAIHTPDRNAASVYASGAWRTPLGNVPIDEELARSLLGTELFSEATAAHRHEHSIEVQLPILQRLLPAVRILPISVQPAQSAADVGRTCAAATKSHPRRVGFLGSTDLTHYGPAFGFEPSGHGLDGIRWAKDINDRRLINFIKSLDASGIVSEAARNRNACGAGAIAALVAAMRELGATCYTELRHTCSAECCEIEAPDRFNSVGYEAGVFTRPARN